MKEKPKIKPLCKSCGEPMAKSGKALRKGKIVQVFKCCHKDCPNKEFVYEGETG